MTFSKLSALTFVFFIATITTCYSTQPDISKDNFSVVLSENEDLRIPVDSSSHPYIILNCTNKITSGSVFITSSSLKGVPLDDTVQGPESFRKVVLGEKNSSVTKTFLCKGKDLLVLKVIKGLIEIEVIKVPENG